MEAALGAGSVVRAPGLKRGKVEEAITDRMKLERVLGLTVSSNAALACDPNTQLVAYPAGCTVVLYNVRKNRQSHVLNSSRKSIACVSFSPDGRYLATGESGHAPQVRIWDLQDPSASGAVQIAEFPGHTHGVSCVAFSRSSKYLVSVGSQHDMIVNVWDWRSNLKLASNKVSSRVKAVAFSENGNYFVTVGFRHVKFWYLEYSRNAKFLEPVPLMGRSAILGEQKDNEFCDVVCGRGEAADSTYAITRGGLLCEFNSRRLLDKWLELRTTSANCMAIGSQYLVVGCAEGIVRVFCPRTLQYVTTLPRTHYLGVDVAMGDNIQHMFGAGAGARFPDAVALTYDELNHKLTAVYNDHSLYVWDVRDIKRVGKCHSALYHSACIWGVDMARGAAEGEAEGEDALPPSTFLTCSSDDTVRMWRLSSSPHNIYSNELVRTLYIDPEMKFLKDVELTGAADKDKKTYDERTGVRCVRVSRCGRHVACGDRAGNVWVFAARGALLHTLEAHDAEVLCLEYSARPRLLASASRDRLIHLFQVDKGYTILQTLDEHSSSITAVRFLGAGAALQLVSCGADKTILFRQLVTCADGSPQFERGVNVSGRSTLYDMEVDAGGRHVLTACQDRNVRVYSAAHGRHTKTFRGTTAEDGTLIKVALDSSGIYLATSSTDKILSVYDYYSGECMATMYGHSEIVTGLRFTADCQHLVSASGDGCVFVWRVPHDMVVTMRARLAQQAIRTGKKPSNGADSEGESAAGSPPRDPAPHHAHNYTLRIGKLPSWANKRLGDEPPAPPAPAPPPEPPARGKWAQRIHPAEKRVDSDGSKDSSIDSGTDTRYFDRRRDNKQGGAARAELRTRHLTDDSSLGSLRYEDVESTEHDGDIEDISDGERTSSSESRARPTYYPGNNHADTAGEFMVNAMDAEELRASVRRGKRWGEGAGSAGEPPAASLSGSQHDSDDDEASTPSGDNQERPPLSPAWGAERRETYLQSAFDSLTDRERDNNTAGNTCSLSSQHLSRAGGAGGAGSAAGAGSARGKAVDPEAARRRDELNRRILETRRQLETMAFRGSLKSSQSSTDLSYLPEKEGGRRARPLSLAAPAQHNYGAVEEALDSLNSNYFDSLNPYQALDYRTKNPYAIPANLNKHIPEHDPFHPPYVPPHPAARPPQSDKRPVNFTPYGTKPVVFKEQQHKPLAFTVDMKPPSKVFDRLFPAEDKEQPKSRNFHLNLSEKPQPKTPKPSARSIFKNYKSCPVSPVSEECKWADKAPQSSKHDNANRRTQTSSLDPKKRNSLSFFVGLDSKTIGDNGRSIVDTIKSDTERMIAEITKKYGDLDEYEPHADLDVEPTKEVEEKDDGNFSSDSLEDCSLSQDASCKNKLYSKKVCKKHNKAVARRAVSSYEIAGGADKPALPAKPAGIAAQRSSTLPRNMPSELGDTLRERSARCDHASMYRCQSVLTKRCITRSNESVLSENSDCSSVSNEIFLKYGNEVAFQQAKLESRYHLNDSQNCSFENLNEPDENYMEKHRHSSASFFLNQKKYMKTSCSQESVLSDEYLDHDNQLSRTNCNSLESVLSDDSECTKSAPLEMLFEGARPKRPPNNAVHIPRNTKSCYEFENGSKSYGSSPNNAPSYFGGYMYNNYMDPSSPKCTAGTMPKPVSSAAKPVSKVCGFQVSSAEGAAHRTVTRSKSLYDTGARQQPPPPAKNIAYYFDGSNVQQYTKDRKQTDEIPRLNTSDYMASKTKSLQPKFADKYKSEMEGCEQGSKPMVKSRSCSFEVMLEPASKPNPLKNLMEKRNSHVQKNLEKFEEQIRKSSQSKTNKNQTNKDKASGAKCNNTTKSLERGSGQKNNNTKINMEFVPHKPPKPMKRTSSVKINNRLKAGLDKSTLSSSISSQYKAKLDGLQNKNYVSNKRQEDPNSNIESCDAIEKTFDVFIKEKDVNENKSEMQMDSLEVYAMQKMERMKHVSMDSLDVIDHNDFAKDSLDYYAEQENKFSFGKTIKDQINLRIANNERDFNTPSDTRDDNESKENIAPVSIDEIKKYKYIERKLEIINKLVEMEERKILQEKIFKEWRMRPLRANINDGKGVVKVLSRKFEKLATKTSTTPNFASLTLEEVDADAEAAAEVKEIKRNLSLPDILDSEQIGGLVTADTEAEPVLNNSVQTEPPKSLKQRVYNETVIPKTDVHLDSENYESSTTSSSCTNSPKRLSVFGFSRAKTPFRKVLRIPPPRLCSGHRPAGPLPPPRCRLPPAPAAPTKLAPTPGGAGGAGGAGGEAGGGMRRACSLSDLAAPQPAPRGPLVTATRPAAPPKQSGVSAGGAGGAAGGRSPSGFARPAPRYHAKSNMTRSSSVGVLNQSDSESESGAGSRGAGGGGGARAGLMRPTISSMNKMAAAARRRGPAHAHSAVSLATGAPDESSSEEAEPRPRAASIDTRRPGRAGELSSKAREVTARLTAPPAHPAPRPRARPDAPPDPDMSSSSLCAALTEQLTRTAGKVVQLYASLRLHPAAPPADISGLEAAILETQKMLRGAVSGSGPPAPGEARELLDSALNKEGAVNESAMSLIEQYSDMLLNMMQHKMVGQLPAAAAPRSLPPAPDPAPDS